MRLVFLGASEIYEGAWTDHETNSRIAVRILQVPFVSQRTHRYHSGRNKSSPRYPYRSKKAGSHEKGEAVRIIRWSVKD